MTASRGSSVRKPLISDNGPVARKFYEHPRLAVTIPCAILIRILRDHLGPLRTARRPGMAPSNGSSTGLCGRPPPSRSSRAPPPSEATEGVETPGNYQAAQLRVAEQYVEKLGLLAKENDTMIVPITVGDVSSTITERRAPYDRGREHPALGNVAFRRPSCRDVLSTSSALCGRVRVQVTDFLCRRRRPRPRVVEGCGSSSSAAESVSAAARQEAIGSVTAW